MIGTGAVTAPVTFAVAEKVAAPVTGLIDNAAYFQASLLSTSIVRGIGELSPPSIGDSDGDRLVADHENIWRSCKAEEVRIAGARRVENLIPSTGTGSASLAVSANKTMTLPAGKYIFSMGPGSGTATFSGTGGATGTLTANSQSRTAVSKTIVAGTLVVTASVADLVDLQVEYSTGRSDTDTPSEYVSTGVLTSPFHGYNVDGVKYYITENGNSVTNNVVTEGVGEPIAVTPPEYVELSGDSGSYVSSPDSAAASITGDFEIVVKAALDDWTPAASNTIVSKYNTPVNQRAYALSIESTGAVALRLSDDGANFDTGLSSVATGFTDGQANWIKATYDSSAQVVNFFTSADGVTFTQLGLADRSVTIASIFDSTANLNVGSLNDGGLFRMTGKVYEASIYDGIGGTLVAQFRASDGNLKSPKTVTSVSTGEVWTVNGNGFLDTSASPVIQDGIKGLYMEGAHTELSGRSADLGNWNGTMTATVTQDRVGLDGAPATGFTVTDNSASVRQRIEQETTVPADSKKRFMKAYIEYDASPAVYPFVFFAMSGGTPIFQSIVLDPSDGSYSQLSGGGTVEAIYRNGNYWVVVQSITNNGTNTVASMNIDPAGNTDGSSTLVVNAQGSTGVAICELFTDNWSYAPILTTGGTPKTVNADTEYTLDVANWPDGDISASFELTPYFDEATGVNQGIITPNDSVAVRGITFDNSVDGALELNDGSSVEFFGGALSGFGDTNIIKLVAGNGRMNLSSDGASPAGEVYDGSFDPSGAIVLGKSLTRAMAIKELKIYSVDLGNDWLTRS